MLSIKARKVANIIFKVFGMTQLRIKLILLCFFLTFRPIFHFTLCSFCWLGAQEYFLLHGVGYPRYVMPQLLATWILPPSADAYGNNEQVSDVLRYNFSLNITEDALFLFVLALFRFFLFVQFALAFYQLKILVAQFGLVL